MSHARIPGLGLGLTLALAGALCHATPNCWPEVDADGVDRKA